MPEINCSSCKKQDCPTRIEGAVCSVNPETEMLIRIYESRDPVLISRKLARVLGTEFERYEKAVEREDIGGEIVKTITTKNGNEMTFTEEKGPNPAITQMAHGIIKSGKLIHEIVNPPKVQPLFQQNNQYNIGNGIRNEIEALDDKNKEEAIAYINEKLNAA